MEQRIVEAVPNFSEGQRPAVIARLAAAASSVPGALLLDRTADADHNRCVLTIAGDPEAVLEAAIRAAGVAAAEIDLTLHRGVHPRIGACDVLPFVPVSGVTLADCVTLAHRAGEAIWQRFRVPVYFYEAAARSEARRNLADVRRGGFENPAAGPPDVGDGLHRTAGATIVGARKFLIAYNIHLATHNLGIAKDIAREIRTASGGLPALKALGLPLASRGLVQVSMNLVDFEQTSIDQVFETVERLAAAKGVAIAASELIGLIPRAAVPRGDVRWENFDESRVLENRLEEAMANESRASHSAR